RTGGHEEEIAFRDLHLSVTHRLGRGAGKVVVHLIAAVAAGLAGAGGKVLQEYLHGINVEAQLRSDDWVPPRPPLQQRRFPGGEEHALLLPPPLHLQEDLPKGHLLLQVEQVERPGLETREALRREVRGVWRLM